MKTYLKLNSKYFELTETMNSMKPSFFFKRCLRNNPSNLENYNRIPDEGGVYRISFQDNKFYIGRSKNIRKRIYGHFVCINQTRPKSKTERIIQAILNDESVCIEVLSYNEEDEERLIYENRSKLCLNLSGNVTPYNWRSN